MNTVSDSKYPVSLYSTWYAKPEQEKALLPVLENLAKDVMANEEGTLMYLVHIASNDYPFSSLPPVTPGTIVFVEKYRNWDAFLTHVNGTIFTTFKDKYKSKFVPGADGNPYTQVVFMNQEAGFVRSNG